MKRILYFLCVVVIVSCNNYTEPKDKKETKKEVVKKIDSTSIVKIIKEKDSVVVKKEELIFLDPMYLIQFSKSPCSGDCTVFNVLISKDSTLTFNGKSLTYELGEHKIKLDQKTYTAIEKSINNLDFEILNTDYSTGTDKDFSKNTFTFYKNRINVVLWKNAPKELVKLYTTIEDILYENQFLKE